MEKLIALAVIVSMLLLPAVCMADEAEQTIKNNQTYITGNLEKMPENQNGKEKIENHFTFFTINAIINGKTEYKNFAEDKGLGIKDRN